MVRLGVSQAAGRAIPRRLLHAAAAASAALHPELHGVVVSVAIVGDQQMRRLNRIYHGVDATTDVLTFSLSSETVEIVVCYDQARRQAGEVGWPIAREVELLLVHGLLHSVGFNDQNSRQERAMRQAEAAVIARLRRPRHRR